MSDNAKRFAEAVSALFEGDGWWSVLDLDGAKEFFEEIGYVPSKSATSTDDEEQEKQS